MYCTAVWSLKPTTGVCSGPTATCLSLHFAVRGDHGPESSSHAVFAYRLLAYPGCASETTARRNRPPQRLTPLTRLPADPPGSGIANPHALPGKPSKTLGISSLCNSTSSATSHTTSSRTCIRGATMHAAPSQRAGSVRHEKCSCQIARPSQALG